MNAPLIPMQAHLARLERAADGAGLALAFDPDAPTSDYVLRARPQEQGHVAWWAMGAALVALTVWGALALML
jgi:hypothetical protein